MLALLLPLRVPVPEQVKVRLEDVRHFDQLLADVDEAVPVRGRQEPVRFGELGPGFRDRGLVRDLFREGCRGVSRISLGGIERALRARGLR